MPPPPLQHNTYILQHAQMRLDPNLKIENDSLKEPFSKYRHDSERVAVFYIIQVGVVLPFATQHKHFTTSTNETRPSSTNLSQVTYDLGYEVKISDLKELIISNL